MKKHILLPCAIGVGIAAVTLTASWLADAVFHAAQLPFQDMSFLLGILFLLLGLMALFRGGRSQAASTACTPYNATAQMAFTTQAAYEEQKILSNPKLTRRERGPSLTPSGIALAAAGVLSLIAYGISLL